MHWIALQTRPDAAATQAAEGAPADAMLALGWWALQFTPRVAQAGDAVVFEVSESDRLFGGRQQLIEQVLASSLQLGPVRVAQARTSVVALAQLQLDPADYHGPDRLPLVTLPEAREHLPTLKRLGCTLWGDLRALPRGGVARRFGAGLLDGLDRAYGLKPEVYAWLQIPEVFDLPLELFAQVETAPALMFAAHRLLSQLRIWLQARQRGIVAMELVWEMDARRNTPTHGQLLVRTAEPTRDMQHMQRLLAENLARISLPAPVLYLRLRSVETAPLPGVSDSLLPDALLDGDSLNHLLERLSARLGKKHVLRAVPYADHRPEHMQIWVDFDKAGKPALAPAAAVPSKKRKTSLAPDPHQTDGLLYPTWLLAAPLKLAVRDDRPMYQGPLALLAGPQRLEAAWWDVAQVQPARAGSGKPLAVLRDYFLARSEQAGLLWIYRERLTGAQQEAALARRLADGHEASHWYLQGLFG
jgi:protein ImuB